MIDRQTSWNITASDEQRRSDEESASPLPSLPSEPGRRANRLRFVFFGSDGLRAGWGLLLFAVFVILLGQLGTAALRAADPHPPRTTEQIAAEEAAPQAPETVMTIEGLNFAVVAVATFAMAKIERRKLGTYGFGGTRKVTHFFTGLGWGVVFLATLVGVFWKAGLLVFTGRLIFGREALRYGAIWAAGFLLVCFFEEYALRGYLQYTLSRGLAGIYGWLFESGHGKALGFWTAAVLLSFVFGLGHGNNPGESPIGLWSAGLVGLVFCLSLWRTGSLWWALGFHAAWDWAQSFLFGVADSGLTVQGHLLATHPAGKVLLSGGATGPEGSLLVLPVLALAALVAIWTLKPQTDSRTS